MIVVGIIGLLAALAVPSVAKARDTSRMNLIYSNLRALETAKDQWAVENNAATGTPVPDLTVLKTYLRYGTVQSVVNEVYLANPVGVAPEADLPAGVTVGPYGPGAIIAAP